METTHNIAECFERIYYVLENEKIDLERRNKALEAMQEIEAMILTDREVKLMRMLINDGYRLIKQQKPTLHDNFRKAMYSLFKLLDFIDPPGSQPIFPREQEDER